MLPVLTIDPLVLWNYYQPLKVNAEIYNTVITIISSPVVFPWLVSQCWVHSTADLGLGPLHEVLPYEVDVEVVQPTEALYPRVVSVQVGTDDSRVEAVRRHSTTYSTM